MKNFKKSESAFLFFLVSHIWDIETEKRRSSRRNEKKSTTQGRTEPSEKKRKERFVSK